MDRNEMLKEHIKELHERELRLATAIANGRLTASKEAIDEANDIVAEQFRLDVASAFITPVEFTTKPDCFKSKVDFVEHFCLFDDCAKVIEDHWNEIDRIIDICKGIYEAFKRDKEAK